jgi:hypothetical protein
VASGVYRVFSYSSGTRDWCGACHNKFKAPTAIRVANSGHAEQDFGMWRHPMRGHIWFPEGADISMETGTPPEPFPNSQIYRIGCLTCHRAHSTTAAMNGWATSWPRDLGLSGPGTTSALLRMDSRGMCYNCHRAGEYNCWNDTRPVPLRRATSSSPLVYVPMSCSGDNNIYCHYDGANSHQTNAGPYDCGYGPCHNGLELRMFWPQPPL